MNICPWCGNKAVVRNSPLGYYAECSKNGHVHNIGVLVPATSSYSKTENEAKILWNKATKEFSI